MRIGVLGCAGRMGRAVIGEILATEGCSLAGGIESPGHAALGQDLGARAGADPAGLVAGENAEALIAGADVVIEFSAPEATAGHAAMAAE
ncbi:MAG: 4-hydroxy-tetrahydrodipicolinate reductase, partial [Geminicoccaceae bacterium]